jgi:hypothetical protein
MTLRRLLPLAFLGLGACAAGLGEGDGTAAPPPPAAATRGRTLLDRLPPEIAGFAAFDPALAQAPPPGMLLRPYRSAGAQVIRVTLQPVLPEERAAMAAGAEAAPLRDRLDAEAAAIFAFASGLPQSIAERGPDFLVGPPGSGPLLRCIDVRLARPQGVLRNLTCAGSLEEQVVRMQMTSRQAAEPADLRLLAEFGGRAMQSLSGALPEPQEGTGAAPVPPRPAAPRRAEGLRRV